MAQVTAHYERKLSDGNYGSEGLALSWTWDVQEHMADEIDSAIDILRTRVLTELANSASEQVRFIANHELRARAPA